MSVALNQWKVLKTRLDPLEQVIFFQFMKSNSFPLSNCFILSMVMCLFDEWESCMMHDEFPKGQHNIYPSLSMPASKS